MTPIVIDNIISVVYLLVWIATLIYYHHKSHVADAGSLIIISYICYAFFSIMTLNDPIPIKAYLYDSLTVFPYIYLYVMLLIALSPAIYHHISPTLPIEEPPTRVFKILTIIIISSAIALIPSVIGNIEEGLVMLFLDNDAGKDAYEEQLENVRDSGSAITNIPAIIYNMLFDISVFICFYFLSLKKKNLWLLIPLLLSLIIGIMMPIMKGQRSVVILNIFTIMVGYMLFRKYITKRINTIFKNIGIAAIILISLPIVAITISRFEGRKESSVTSFLVWYVGQGNLYFNNHGLDAGGIRNGDRTVNLFKRLIDSKTPKNYMERRDKYHNLELDDNLFSTFVGDFAIDFGPIIAVVIFIVFNTMVLTQLRPRGDTIKVDQLLLLYFTLCICMQGGMYLFAYADGGNLRIISFALLYTYLRYHEALIRKFPLYA